MGLIHLMIARERRGRRHRFLLRKPSGIAKHGRLRTLWLVSLEMVERDIPSCGGIDRVMKATRANEEDNVK